MEQKTMETKAVSPSAADAAKEAKDFRQWKTFLLAVSVLAIGFALPLYRLVRFACSNELYSYIVLMPFICWYLVHLKKAQMPADSRPMRGASIPLLLAGAGVLAYYFAAVHTGGAFETEDGLALMTLAFVFLFFGAALALLGRETIRTLAFPLAMMVFVVPMPVFLRSGTETFLQYGSAYVTHGMFKLSGMPFVRNGLVFMLPGLPNGIQIARECSGIHSTLILFITSLLAGYLFLRSPWKRAVLALAVVPLGLLRNGFRVFTIGQLCVHYGPQMIDSPIHRKGGPLFFVLSLIPFFAMLVWLCKSERRQVKPVKA